MQQENAVSAVTRFAHPYQFLIKRKLQGRFESALPWAPDVLNGKNLWREHSFRFSDFEPLAAEEFLDAVYRAVLKRYPDRAGFDHYLQALQGGRSKTEVMSRLRYSPEGVRIGVTVEGLEVPLRIRLRSLLRSLAPGLADGWKSVRTLAHRAPK